MQLQCRTFCTADSYQMDKIYQFFKSKDVQIEKYKNVIHLCLGNENIFFFAYGCVVFWQLEEEHIEYILKIIKPFENNSASKLNTDSYYIVEGNQNKIYQSEVTLAPQAGVMEKLAISYALAQSMKLAVFEERVDHTIKKTEHIPKALSVSGKIPLSGKEIAQKMGNLFLERSSINLHSDILDTPEFFWEFPEFEHLYHMAAKDQDIKQRVDILNKRLNLIHELFQMLSDVFNNRHSSILEIIIIVLIALEIILTIAFKIVK